MRQKILVLVILIMLMPSLVWAASVKLAWEDPNPPEAGVTGYTLHYGSQSRQYTSEVNTGKVLEYTLTGLADGRYFISCTAHDAAKNRSDYSEEVMVDIDTTAPAGVQKLRVLSVGRE